MSYTNLTNSSLYGSLAGKLKDAIPKVLTNAPVSSYTKPLDMIRQTIMSRSSDTDALILGLSSVTELYDAAATVAVDLKGERPTSGFSFPISQDSLDMLISAFKQCGVRDGSSFDYEDWDLFVSSTTGLEYCMRMRHLYTDDIYVFEYMSNNGQADFISYRYDAEHNLIPYMRFWAEPITHPEGYSRESVLEIVKGLLYSQELNIEIANVCGTLIRGNFENFLKSIDFQSKIAPVRKFLNQLVSAFNQGGLKGAIYYIFSYFQALSTLSDEDGLLAFTDNNKLRPAEYIAGFVSTAFAAVGVVVTTIITIFTPIIGAIAAVVGSIAWAIFGNFKYDYSNTRASLICEDDFNHSQIIDTMPHAGFQDTFPASVFPAFQDYYDRGDSILAFDVPGGQLFIGPGAFSEDNNTITSLRCEFHALAPSFDWTGRLLPILIQYQKTREIATGVQEQIIDLKELWTEEYQEDSWLRLWKYVTDWSQYASSTALTNNSDGVLSEDMDKAARKCAEMSLIVFTLHLLFNTDSFANAIDDVDELYIWKFPASAQTAQEEAYDYVFIDCISPTRLINGYVQSWDDILKAYECTNSNDSDVWYKHTLGRVTLPNIQIVPFGVSTSISASTAVVADTLYCGMPYAMPMSFRYGINLPKYNSTTFFTWIAATILTTALITTVTVFATVKTVQFIKRKRASNIAKYFSAQSKYQSAEKGLMQVEDPETGEITEITYDMNSDEGKAYLNDCYKSYKRTAFKNNLWAHFIGGTRFDTTTFYGEADSIAVDQSVSEEANFADLYSYIYQDPQLQSDDSAVTAVLDAVKGVRNLIKLDVE